MEETGSMYTDVKSLEEFTELLGSRQAVWNYLFHYDAGRLFWKNPRAARCKPGDLAGSMNTRYFAVMVFGKTTYLHRIIYEMFNGDIPDGFEIDHIDVNSLNNRLENLRLVTRTQNVRNINVRRDSTSGITGVFQHGKRWKAQICIGGKQKNLGLHATKEEAISARKEAEQVYHRVN